MGRVPTIEVEYGLQDHIKVRRAAFLFEVERPIIVAGLISLWLWTAKNAPNGGPLDLVDISTEFGVKVYDDISFVAKSLKESGWLDVVDDKYFIHNWQKRSGKAIAAAEVKRQRMAILRGSDREPQPVVVPVLTPFDEFWMKYPSWARSGKAAAERLWDKLSDQERQEASKCVSAYADIWINAPDNRKSFVPLPKTWLSEKRWLDNKDAWGTRAQVQLGPLPTNPKKKTFKFKQTEDDSIAARWNAITNEIKTVIDQREYESWFRDMVCTGETRHGLTVGLYNGQFLSYIIENYGTQLRSAMEASFEDEIIFEYQGEDGQIMSTTESVKNKMQYGAT